MLKLFNYLGSNISLFGFLYLEVTTTVVVLLEIQRIFKCFEFICNLFYQVKGKMHIS